MQCFRCGAIVSDDFVCPLCGAALEIGQDICPACGSPILCARCREGMPAVGAARPASPTTDGAHQAEPTTLQYEYSTVQIPLYLFREQNETPGHFQQRFHNAIMQHIGSAALEGWETIDPLEYTLLQRNGMVSGGMMSILGRHVVTIRLKRLIGGPGEASQPNEKEDLRSPL